MIGLGLGDEARGRLLVLTAGVFMSVGAPLIRLLEAATEWQFLYYRAIGLVASLAVLLLLRHGAGLARAIRGGGWAAPIGGAFLATAFTAFVFAIMHTTVANALFLLSAAPFIAAVLARLVLGERVHRITIVAMVAAAIGIGVMVREGLLEGDWFGDLAALVAATGFAAFSVVLRLGRASDMVPTVLYAGLFSGGTGALVCLHTGVGLDVPWRDVWVSFAYGIVGIGAGLSLYTAGSRFVPAAELTLLSLTEVILAPIWVWLAFGEVPSRATLIGGLIVLGAVALQAVAGMRAASAPHK